jgi:hypothetical protein
MWKNKELELPKISSEVLVSDGTRAVSGFFNADTKSFELDFYLLDIIYWRYMEFPQSDWEVVQIDLSDDVLQLLKDKLVENSDASLNELIMEALINGTEDRKQNLPTNSNDQ